MIKAVDVLYIKAVDVLYSYTCSLRVLKVGIFFFLSKFLLDQGGQEPTSLLHI